MKRTFIHQIKATSFILIFISAFYSWPVNSETVLTELTSEDVLINELQHGGYIIYMRHGPTNHFQKDTAAPNQINCNEQRNLSPKGRELMTKIGKAVSTLKIPIGDVLSSPYCRCKDSALLVFGKYDVQQDLQFSISKSKLESQHLGKALFKLMMNSNTKDKNSVFVGHTSNLRDGLGVWPKPEGVMAIFKKQEHHLIYKGMIHPETWLK